MQQGQFVMDRHQCGWRLLTHAGHLHPHMMQKGSSGGKTTQCENKLELDLRPNSLRNTDLWHARRANASLKDSACF